MSQAEKIKQEIMHRYFERTKESRKLGERAQNYLPGGDTRSSVFFRPYPVFMAEGQGFRLYDVDGNEYLDCINNFTSLIHGHAYPAVMAALQAQIPKGTALGAPLEIQIRHAELLCHRVPSLELVRYCNSGTEATMLAMRAARAHTGKDVFIKMDGGYHGAHDYVEVNTLADFMAPDLPRTNLERGIPAGVAQDILISPFNDLTALERILSAHRDRIAAIIMEPMLGAGGTIAPEPGYLPGVRELADKFGVLLIFDEVITLRFSSGGMQAISGVKPDLTALGKIIGGGLPVGAFGGRRDIMERFSPLHPQTLAHGGTFNANNASMAAGLAALENYGQADAERLNALGDRLRQGFQGVMDAAGIRGQAKGYGSVIGTIWSDRPIKSSKDVVFGFADSGELPHYVHIEMLNRGVTYAGRGMYALSTPMTEKEVDQVVATLAGTVEMLKPLIVETMPHLLK